MYSSDLYEYPHADRIIVIGDIHGDIKRLKKILDDAKIINDNLEWVANPPNTIVIQIGDQIDSANREPNINEWEIIDDVNIIHFTNCLDNIAKAKGGRFISLIGNHELMNIIGNFTYVSDKSNSHTRYEMFMPKGSLSPILAKRQIVVKIGELFFCHAGIKKNHLDILNSFNKPVSYLNDIWRDFILTGRINQDDKDIFDNIILGNEGILWTRELDNEENMTLVLNNLGCVYMFVGHTPMNTIQLVNKIWYVDTGISRAFGRTSYQYLDITNYIISVKNIDD